MSERETAGPLETRGTLDNDEQGSVEDPAGLFERFFDLIPDLACIASPEGYFKRVNASFERVLGHSRQELLTLPFSTWIHPDDLQETWRRIAQQLEGKTTDGFINRYRCKDGTYRYLEWRTTPATDSLLFATARDVTHRLELEEALRSEDLVTKTVLRLSELTVPVEEFLDRAVADGTVFVNSMIGCLVQCDETGDGLIYRSGYGGVLADDSGGDQCSFALHQAGLWGEVVRNRRPLVLNHLAGQPGECSPVRQPPVHRLLAVPILRNSKVVAVFGVANKPSPYNEQDVRHLVLMADSIWKNFERKKAEEDLRISHERLRLLSAHLESVREEERLKISREVHDELGQMLTAVKFDIHALRGLRGDITASQLDVMDEHVDATLQAVRRISSELRPQLLDQLGLVPALSRYLADFAQRTGITCRDDVALLSCPGAACSIALFRIFQEALTNIERHSEATELTVKLDKSDQEIRLAIRDNGKGIPALQVVAETSFGLMGMRERAALCGGKLQIVAPPGEGTCVTVVIPVPPAGAD